MSIIVTPIPRLIDLAVPAFTLGTANAAGSAATAVASDSTLLAFDTTDPAAVAASAVVGSATTVSHRDHVHPGMTATGSVVDEAIARFDGTGGASLQGYSSLSPTISNAGIISLTSGALKFPATEIASADANTLNDFQKGDFTPTVTFGGNSVGVSYDEQVGKYTKIGNIVVATGTIILTSKGSSTGNAFLGGLPYAASAGADLPMGGGTGRYDGISFVGWISGTVFAATVQLTERTTSGTVSAITDADFSDTTEIYWSSIYNIF